MLAQTNQRHTLATPADVVLTHCNISVSHLAPAKVKYDLLAQGAQNGEVGIRVWEEGITEVEVEYVVAPDGLQSERGCGGYFLQRAIVSGEIESAVGAEVVFVRDVLDRCGIEAQFTLRPRQQSGDPGDIGRRVQYARIVVGWLHPLIVTKSEDKAL